MLNLDTTELAQCYTERVSLATAAEQFRPRHQHSLTHRSWCKDICLNVVGSDFKETQEGC